MISIKKQVDILKKNLKNYSAEVKENKTHPFFNKTGNSPKQWIKKVVKDVKERGVIEGLHDLSYPLLMNPYIEPLTEPLTGKVRVKVSKIPNQKLYAQALRKLLGLPPTINKLP